MNAVAQQIGPIDGLVKVATPPSVDPDIDAQTAFEMTVEYVGANQLGPGMVVVIPQWIDNTTMPLVISFANYAPPQIYCLVVSTSKTTVLVELVLCLFNANGPNPFPPALAQYNFIGPVITGPVNNRINGSTHRFSVSGNVMILSTIGLHLAQRTAPGFNIQRVQVLCPDGLVGVPRPRPLLDATLAPVVLGNANNAAAAGGQAPPAAPVAHNTSAAVARETSMLLLKRFLSRPLPPGVAVVVRGVSTSDFLDEFVGGPQGTLDSQAALMSVMAILMDEDAGVIMDGRLPFENGPNISLLLTMQIGVFPPTVTATAKGNILSSLSVNCFAKKLPNGNPRPPRSVADIHTSLRELVAVYEGLTRKVLGEADNSILNLFAPLVETLDASRPLTRVLSEEFIVLAHVEQEVAKVLFNAGRVLRDPRNANLLWDVVEALVHAEWKKFDIPDIERRSRNARMSAVSKYGLQAPAPQNPAKKIKQPAAAGLPAARKKARGGGGRGGAAQAPAPAAAPTPPAAAPGAAAANPAVRDCPYGSGSCKFMHRERPTAPLSAADKRQWIRDYGGGNLTFKAELAAAINALP